MRYLPTHPHHFGRPRQVPSAGAWLLNEMPPSADDWIKPGGNSGCEYQPSRQRTWIVDFLPPCVLFSFTVADGIFEILLFRNSAIPLCYAACANDGTSEKLGWSAFRFVRS
jgi:hypothetical protein